MLVTARFFTGTNADDAILRVQAKIRANYDKHPARHPRTVDRRARHQRCGGGGPDLVAEAGSRRRAGTKRIFTPWRPRCRRELAKVDNVGLTYIAGRLRRRDQRRARSREALALRRHAAAARSQDPGRQPLLPGRAAARQRPHVPGGRRQDAVGRAGYRPAARHHARRPAGLCARPGQGRHRTQPGRASCLVAEPPAARPAGRRRRPSASPSPSGRAPMPWWWPSS